MPPKRASPESHKGEVGRGKVNIVGQEAIRAATEKEAEKIRDANPDADVRDVGEIRADDW